MGIGVPITVLCTFSFVIFVQCWDVPKGDNSNPFIEENFHQWTLSNAAKCESQEEAAVQCLQRCGRQPIKPAVGTCDKGYTFCLMTQIVSGPWLHVPLNSALRRFGAPYFGGNTVAKYPCNDDRECAILCDTLCNERETSIFPIGDKSKMFKDSTRPESRGCGPSGACLCGLFKEGYLKPAASLIDHPNHKENAKGNKKIDSSKHVSTKRKRTKNPTYR